MPYDKKRLGEKTAQQAETILERLRVQHRAKTQPRPIRLPRRRLILQGKLVDNRPPEERGETAS